MKLNKKAVEKNKKVPFIKSKLPYPKQQKYCTPKSITTSPNVSKEDVIKFLVNIQFAKMPLPKPSDENSPA